MASFSAWDAMSRTLSYLASGVMVASSCLASLVEPHPSISSFRALLLPDSATLAFADLTYGDTGTPALPFSSGSFAATLSASTGNLASGFDAFESEYLTTAAPARVRIDFTAGAPTAIGGQFFGISGDDELWSSVLNFLFSDGTTYQLSQQRTDTTPFLGSVSTDGSAFLWMEFWTDAPETRVGVDNLTFGYVAIPEPAVSAVAMGAAVALLVVQWHKRRRPR